MNNSLKWVAFFLTIGMFICLINYYNINFPIADDYDAYLNFLNNFTVASNFKQQFLAIMVQHVDHRIVMARLVCLLYYKVFGSLNFRYLLYISQVIMLLSIYPFTWLLNRVNPSNKSTNFILATCLMVCPSIGSAYVWLSVTLQQDIQILFSLLSIVFLIKLTERKSITNYLFYILFMLLNVFSESGWVILFGAALLYCLFRREKFLFCLNLIFFLGMAIIFFKVLPYQFHLHKFTSIIDLILFILGFTGATFFTGIPYIAFIVGFLLIATILFNYDVIKSNNVYLIWFLFFFANALIVGIARIGIGSVGTDDRYAIYSLINLGFILTLLTKRYNILNNKKFWITLITIFSLCFIRELPDGGPYQSYQDGKFTLNYPNIPRALKIYHTSTQLGIYNNPDIDTHIKHFYPLKNPPTLVINNSSGSGHLHKFHLDPEYTEVNGTIYLHGFDLNKFDKYLVWQSSEHKYWFYLDAKNSPIDLMLYKITKYYHLHFANISYIKDAKPGNYSILLYFTDGKSSGFITLKNDVKL